MTNDNSIDPGLAGYAQDWDNAAQRVFKGIFTRAERRRMMVSAMRRRAREESKSA